MSGIRVKQNNTSEEEVLATRGYKLVKKIGEGGYAKVYTCEFRTSKMTKPNNLACKVINTMNTPQRFTTKFLPRELNILVKLSHPHIIQVHSIFQRKGKYFIFMRLAEKGDLLDYIVKNGAIAENQARYWTRQIALGLQYLHTMEVAHRDLKCENILITNHHNVKISDFGFARRILNDDNRRELSETFCGSISYAPPQILLGKPYNPKTADMWSLGVMIYTMLNKSNPFDSKNTKLLCEAQLQKRYRFRSKYDNVCSEHSKNAVRNLLEPEELNRWRVDQLIDSSWIAMDTKLKSLNSYEYSALMAAMEEAKSFGVSSEPYEGRTNFNASMKRVNTNRNSLTFFKEYDDGFDLQLIRSEINKVDTSLTG